MKSGKETIFGRIPENWEIKKIKDVTNVVTDYVANGSFASLAENVKYKEEEDVAVLIRLLDYNNNFNGNFVYIDDRAYNYLSKSKLYGGEIIISNVGANVGTVFRCPKLKYKMSLAPNAIMVKFKGNNDFYYFWLRGYHGQKMLKSIITGSAQPKFNKTNFREMEVVVPPLATQNKIAKILSALDDKIECNNQINKNLEEQAKEIFKEWFIDNSENASWKRGNFSDLITSTLSGDWGKDELSGNNTEKVYCIRGADIPEVKTGNKGKMPVRYIIPKNLKSKQLEDGDIVVEISGGSPSQSTGRSTVITQSLLDRYDSSIVCTNFCKALKPVKEYSMFIYYYFQYLYNKNIFFSYENGTTGIKNLDLTGFLETESIVIPPKNLIDDFHKFCTSSFNLIFANGKESENLSNIRDSLLPKLMSGELDVSDIGI